MPNSRPKPLPSFQLADYLGWHVDADGVVTALYGPAIVQISNSPESAIGRSMFDVCAHNPAGLDLLRRVLAGREAHEVVPLDGRLWMVHAQPVAGGGATGVSFPLDPAVQTEPPPRERVWTVTRTIEGVREGTKIIRKDGRPGAVFATYVNERDFAEFMFDNARVVDLIEDSSPPPTSASRQHLRLI